MSQKPDDAIFQAFLTELGAVETENTHVSYWQSFFDYRGHKCSITQNGKKFEISVCLKPKNPKVCHFKSDQMWRELTHSINVSCTRPSRDIVRDFDRRIEWDKIDSYYEQVLVENNAHDEYCNKAENIAKMLGSILEHPLHMVDDGVFTIDVRGGWHSAGERASVWVEGSSINFCLKSIKDEALACELAEVLARYRTK